jgi:hypothetical protein
MVLTCVRFLFLHRHTVYRCTLFVCKCVYTLHVTVYSCIRMFVSSSTITIWPKFQPKALPIQVHLSLIAFVENCCKSGDQLLYRLYRLYRFYSTATMEAEERPQDMVTATSLCPLLRSPHRRHPSSTPWDQQVKETAKPSQTNMAYSSSSSEPMNRLCILYKICYCTASLPHHPSGRIKFDVMKADVH